MRSIQWFLPFLLMPSALVGETAWEQRFHRGQMLEGQAQYVAAEQEFAAALTEAELLGPADWRLPMTLHNQGTVDRELGYYAEAERCYRRAVSIWESRHADRPLDLATSLHNLAALQLVLGRASRAEPLLRRAYELRLRALGPDDPLSGASLHLLARVAQERGRFAESLELYWQSTAVLKAAYGPASLTVADVSHNWALLYRDMHRDADARPLLEGAAAAYGQTAPNHPKLANVLRNLAEVDAAQGDIAEAGRLFTRSIAICKTSLPPGHPQTG